MPLRPRRDSAALVRVALNREPADLVVAHALVADVYTGRLRTANIAVKGDRIAYVGPEEQMVGSTTRVIEADGLLAVPGYIEAHAHPDFIVNPWAAARLYLAHGTTTVVGDNYKPYALLGAEGFLRFNRLFQERWVGRFLWSARLFPESPACGEEALYSAEEIAKVLAVEEVVGLDELSRWPDILGEDEVRERLALAEARGKLLGGHTAGASRRKLAALAAAGLASCHESISVEQARERLENGLYVLLRHSSHRRDLPKLLSLFDGKADASRLIFTGDGAALPFLRRAATPGALVKLAIEGGVEPLAALRAVTLNPATYLGLDRYLGSITPGRAADFCLVVGFEALDQPQVVVAQGRVVVEQARLVGVPAKFPWDFVGFPSWSWPGSAAFAADLFVPPAPTPPPAGGLAWPVMEVTNGIITRMKEVILPVRDGCLALPPGEDLSYLAVLDARRQTVARGIVRGMGGALAGLASSFSCSLGALLVLGNDPPSMALAATRVRELGGGMVVAEQGRVIWELPLELAGQMSSLDFPALDERLQALEDIVRARGYRFDDFCHSLFFLPADFLPFVRLTPEGLYDVVGKRLLHPASALSRAY